MAKNIYKDPDRDDTNATDIRRNSIIEENRNHDNNDSHDNDNHDGKPAADRDPFNDKPADKGFPNDGRRGEERVLHKLDALDPSYIQIAKLNGSDGLKLAEPDSQSHYYIEHDAIIAGNPGVIDIDAKDYRRGHGEIRIEKYGIPHFYHHYDDGTGKVEERSIFVQHNKHVNFLRRLVGRQVPIHGIICFTNKRYFDSITGITPDMKNKLVYIGDLVDVISEISYNSKDKLSPKEVEVIATKLEDARRPYSDKGNDNDNDNNNGGIQL